MTSEQTERDLRRFAEQVAPAFAANNWKWLGRDMYERFGGPTVPDADLLEETLRRLFGKLDDLPVGHSIGTGRLVIDKHDDDTATVSLKLGVVDL
jgi:hypothetical protein